MVAENFPDSVGRVPRNSAIEANRRIEHQIARNLAYFAQHPAEIARRLAELDQEWDIERAIAATAASVGLFGFALAAVRGRRFLLLPAAVSAFLLQHSVQGWCPPIPVLRALGFRTPHEIERERHALKALRGDFEHAHEGDSQNRARSAYEAVSTREMAAIAVPSVAP